MSSTRRAEAPRRIAEAAQNHPDAHDRVSTAEWELRKRISVVKGEGPPTHVFRIGLDADDYDWIALQLGQYLQSVLPDREQWRDGVDHARRMLACALVAAATGTRTDTGFWPEFWRALGLDRDADFESFLRGELDRLLRTSELADFAGHDLGAFRYVSTAMLHAGFPSANLIPLTEFIDELIDERGSIDGESTFGVEIAEHFRSDPDSPAGLRNFAAHVEGAAEIFDRIAEFVDFTRANPDWEDRSAFHGTNGIPALLFDELWKLRADPPTSGECAVERRSGLARPRLRFDLETASIQLALPVVRADHMTRRPEGGDDDGDVKWLLDFGGRTRTVEVPRAVDGSLPALAVSVPEPVDAIHVGNPSLAGEWEVGVVPETAPLILFRTNGDALRNQHSIGATRIFAAAPDGTRFLMQKTTGEWAETDAPALELTGWPGWCVFELSFADARALRARFPDGRTTIRQIARNAEAHFDVRGIEIDGLFAISGEQVLSASPLLTVPGGDDWSVSVDYVTQTPGETGEDVRETLTRADDFEIAADEVDGPVEVFRPIFDDAWVGVYRVSLYRGGLKKLERRFAIAEGLTAAARYDGEHDHFLMPDRKTRERRLSTMTFQLSNSGDKELRFPIDNLSVGGDSGSRDVEVGSPADFELKARYRPRSLRFTIDRADGVRRWSHTFSTLDLDDIDPNGKLTVHFPDVVHDVRLRFLSSPQDNGGATVSATSVALSKAAGSANSWTCANYLVTDALGESPERMVVIEWHPWTRSEEFDRKHPEARNTARGRRREARADVVRTSSHTRMYRIIQRPVIGGAEIVPTAKGDELVLTPTRARGDELTVWAWPLAAPYRAAEISPSFDPSTGTYRAELPGELSLAGPLLVDARRKAPFIFLDTAPDRPTGNAVVADQDGFWPIADDAESRIARFLAGDPDFRPGTGDSPTFWRAVDMLGHVISRRRQTRGPIDDVRRIIHREIVSRPRHSMGELGRSTIPRDEQPGLFIGSGLATEPFPGEDTFNAYHPVSWIGVMEEMNDLIQLRDLASADPGRNRERDDSLAYISESGGEPLIHVLRTGNDALSRAITIGDAVLSCYDRGGIAAVRDRFAHDLPGIDGTAPEVSPHGRWAAHMELMSAIPGINELAEPLQSLVDVAKRWSGLLRSVHNESVIRNIAELDDLATTGRRLGRPWLAAPYISYVFATLARFEAHGVIRRVDALHVALPHWQSLANRIPALTTFDILMAEAVALHTAYGDLTAPIDFGTSLEHA